MNTTHNVDPPTIQTESPILYRNNVWSSRFWHNIGASKSSCFLQELGGANTEGSSALQLQLHADSSLQTAQTAFDPLDPRQPLPEMWCSNPQTSLPSEMLYPDFSSGAVAGNHALAPPEGGLGPRRSLVSSARDPPDPLIASSQVNVRAFPCLFIQLEHNLGDAYVHPDAPGPGRLQLISNPSELEHWLRMIRGLTQSSRGPNGGEDTQIHHGILVPPAQTQRDIYAGFCSSSMDSPASAPPAAQSAPSGWHPGLASSSQPTYQDHLAPQAPMSATPMSVPAFLPSSRFNQGAVPRSSYPGPSDSRCASAPTSIPAASRYHDAPASLTRPPPPISHTANLDPSRSAVHPHTFYHGSAPSMDGRALGPFDDPLVHLPAVPQPTFANDGTAPVYPAQGQPPLAVVTHWPAGEQERTYHCQPRGRRRS